jgi:hypothetical protein
LGIEVQSLEVRGPDDLDGAFEAVRKQRPDAMITVEDPLTFTYRKRIADFATGQQLPTLHGLREFVAAGGLSGNSLAVYVDMLTIAVDRGQPLRRCGLGNRLPCKSLMNCRRFMGFLS